MRQRSLVRQDETNKTNNTNDIKQQFKKLNSTIIFFTFFKPLVCEKVSKTKLFSPNRSKIKTNCLSAPKPGNTVEEKQKKKNTIKSRRGGTTGATFFRFITIILVGHTGFYGWEGGSVLGKERWFRERCELLLRSFGARMNSHTSRGKRSVQAKRKKYTRFREKKIL